MDNVYTAFRLDIFPYDGNVTHMYLENLEDLHLILATIDITKAYHDITRSIFLLRHVYNGQYTPVERIRHNYSGEWRSTPVFYNKEKNIVLTGTELNESLTYTLEAFEMII